MTNIMDPRVRALYYLHLLPHFVFIRRNFEDLEAWRVLSGTVIDILNYDKYKMSKAIVKDLINDS